MLVEILKDNTKEFDKELLDYAIQLSALNYLKRNGGIKEKIYNKVKCAIIPNYTFENKL